MYLNFNLNTNYKIRSPLYDKFRIHNWVNVENHSLDKLKYVDDLKNSTFVLCPLEIAQTPTEFGKHYIQDLFQLF